MPYRTVIAAAANGNADAAAFLERICEALHFWDDLADGDKPITLDALDAGFWGVLVELPRNRFYRAYFDELQPVLVTAIQNWRVANMMEREGRPDDLPISFIIRSSYVDLVTHTALLCGGMTHAAEVGREARRLWHSEGYAGYLAGLEAERTAAAGGENGILRGR